LAWLIRSHNGIAWIFIATILEIFSVEGSHIREMVELATPALLAIWYLRQPSVSSMAIRRRV
jgi:hypothetical protein